MKSIYTSVEDHVWADHYFESEDHYEVSLIQGFSILGCMSLALSIAELSSQHFQETIRDAFTF